MTFDYKKTFENISKTVAKANKDTMKMLVSLPEFQKRVAEIRKEYNIPESGLTESDETEKWHNDLYESDERTMNWLNDVRSLWERCQKLQHDPRYIEHIKRYVLFNQVTAPFCNGNASMSFPDWRNHPDRRNFSIKVYHKLTKDEQDFVMHDLERLMNRYAPGSQKKLRPKPELDRNLAVIEKTKQLGDMVMTHDGAYEYNYNDLVAEVYEDDYEKDDTFSSDKKRKEALRKSKQRTEKYIKDRLGWDSL